MEQSQRLEKTKIVTAITHPNIALIKYWGKRNKNLLLPTKSSISIGLSELETITTVSLSEEKVDCFFLNKQKLYPHKNDKLFNFISFIKNEFSINYNFIIHSQNNFATSAGMASSASGFSALTLAILQFCNIILSTKELSQIARRGSGSACRSIYGGFVFWNKGNQEDGSDSYAEQLFSNIFFQQIRIISVEVSTNTKHISSTIGMDITVQTSHLYKQWVKDSNIRLQNIISAITNKDFSHIGFLAEEDCKQMHEAMKTSRPSICYWSPKTLKIISSISYLRKNGIECYFTIDAGPNVFVLCIDKDVNYITNYLKSVNNVNCVINKIPADPKVNIN